MFDPPKDNRSVASLQDYCPGIDVHHSSGIFNKAFYLLSHRPGWDVRRAFHIFVIANKLYWRENTNFADGACGAVKAAKDLGYSAEDVEAVFRDVDVEPCVETRFNFQGLVRRPLKPNGLFHKYFDLKSDINEITIEVCLERSSRGSEGDSDDVNATFNLEVSYNGRMIHEVSSNKTIAITLKDLKPGRYYITLKGYIPLMSVYVVFDYVFHSDLLVHNTTSGKFMDSVSFNITDARSTDGIVIRSKAEGEFNMFTRYGMKVDITNYKFDKWGDNMDNNTVHVLYCSSNTGLYDVAITTDKLVLNVTVDVYKVFNLFPQTELL